MRSGPRQLSNGMIMLGSAANESRVTPLMVQPRRIDGKNTVSLCLLTNGPDGLYAQVRAHGADIVFPLEDMPYGGKSFTCHDLEGYLCHFGSYDPWQTEPQA